MTFWVSCRVTNEVIQQKRHFGHYFCVSKLPFSGLPDMVGNWHRRSRSFHVKMRRFLVLQFTFNIANLYVGKWSWNIFTFLSSINPILWLWRLRDYHNVIEVNFQTYNFVIVFRVQRYQPCIIESINSQLRRFLI